ncbi:hypothetical protein ACWCQ0_40940 [Streptomyces massasporeus]
MTASALTRLAGDRAHGVKATPEARFSAGVPWQINLISSDVPALSSASGTTTGSVTIPTRYRGEALATMEARYADGSNAGSADWTPYHEPLPSSTLQVTPSRVKVAGTALVPLRVPWKPKLTEPPVAGGPL